MKFNFNLRLNRRRGSKRAPTHRSVGKSKRMTGVFLLLFGLFFFAAGSAVTWFLTVATWQRYIDSASWVETPAKIESAKIHVSHSSDSTTYRPDITFSYEFNGQPYTSDTWSITSYSSSRGWANGVLEQYPRGSVHTALVNPASPSEAVLNRDAGAGLWLSFMPLIFVFAGAGIMVGGIVTFSKSRRNPGATRSGDSLAHADLRDGSLLGLPDFPLNPRGSPLELKPKTGSFARLGGVAAAVIFWNAISWTIFFAIKSEGSSGDGADAFPLLFISIFLIIGACGIAWWIHTLLGFLIGPHITLTSSSPVLLRGLQWDLSWRFTKGFGWVRVYSISIKGQTVAEYTSGGKNSNRVVNREVFLSDKLADSAMVENAPEGSAEWLVPPELPPSFAAPSNRIRYFVWVEANVALLPNLKQEYELLMPPIDGI